MKNESTVMLHIKNKKTLFVLSLISVLFFVETACCDSSSNENPVEIIFSEKIKNPSKKYRFIVPYNFKPKSIESMFEVMFNYKTGIPLDVSGVATDEVVHVLVCYNEDGFMRSESWIKKVRDPSYGIKLIESRSGIYIYEHSFYSKNKKEIKENLYIFSDGNGFPVVVEWLSSGGKTFRVYHKYNEKIELDYLFGSGNKIEDIKKIDSAVLKLIDGFYVNH